MPLRAFTGAIAPVLLLPLGVSGCAAQREVALPARAGATSLPPAAPAAVTAASTVTTAYLSYWAAYSSATRIRSVAAGKRLLSPYATAQIVAQAMASPPRMWAAGQASYGFAVPHVLSVTVRGASASLHDCLDLSHFGTQDLRTGRVVAGSLGLPMVDLYATLVRSGQRWLVSKLTVVEVPCQP